MRPIDVRSAATARLLLGTCPHSFASLPFVHIPAALASIPVPSPYTSPFSFSFESRFATAIVVGIPLAFAPCSACCPPHDLALTSPPSPQTPLLNRGRRRGRQRREGGLLAAAPPLVSSSPCSRYVRCASSYSSWLLAFVFAWEHLLTFHPSIRVRVRIHTRVRASHAAHCLPSVHHSSFSVQRSCSPRPVPISQSIQRITSILTSFRSSPQPPSTVHPHPHLARKRQARFANRASSDSRSSIRNPQSSTLAAWKWCVSPSFVRFVRSFRSRVSCPSIPTSSLSVCFRSSPFPFPFPWRRCRILLPLLLLLLFILASASDFCLPSDFRSPSFPLLPVPVLRSIPLPVSHSPRAPFPPCPVPCFPLYSLASPATRPRPLSPLTVPQSRNAIVPLLCSCTVESGVVG